MYPYVFHISSWSPFVLDVYMHYFHMNRHGIWHTISTWNLCWIDYPKSIWSRPNFDSSAWNAFAIVWKSTLNPDWNYHLVPPNARVMTLQRQSIARALADITLTDLNIVFVCYTKHFISKKVLISQFSHLHESKMATQMAGKWLKF